MALNPISSTSNRAFKAAVGFLLVAVVAGKDLKVFVLGGQSNMEGKGVVFEPTGVAMNGSLQWQLHVDHTYLPVCQTMAPAPRVGCRAEAANFSGLCFEKNATTNCTTADEWKSFPGVWASYKGSHDRNGTMTIGYGFNTNWIGPEYGFGKTMGEFYTDQFDVLVIKICWGGTAIETDWRPPSSGGKTGWCYGNFTAMLHSALETELDKLVPGFNYNTDKYDLAGFGWHQGWNDGCGVQATNDYATNLANLVHDIRAEFKSPKLPVSIALSGFGGWGQSNVRRLGIMAAQYNVTQNSSLGIGTVAAVETRGFFRSFSETHGAINQGYHWFGNAETYFYIGTAMGEAMKHLLEGSWKQPVINTKPPPPGESNLGENDDQVW